MNDIFQVFLKIQYQICILTKHIKTKLISPCTLIVMLTYISTHSWFPNQIHSISTSKFQQNIHQCLHFKYS